MPVSETSVGDEDLARRVDELLDQQRATSAGRIRRGLGIEAEYAALGRIGFPGRYDYGVIGPVYELRRAGG
jgi:hypothetical protein